MKGKRRGKDWPGPVKVSDFLCSAVYILGTWILKIMQGSSPKGVDVIDVIDFKGEKVSVYRRTHIAVGHRIQEGSYAPSWANTPLSTDDSNQQALITMES